MQEVFSAISSLILGLVYFFRLISIPQAAHRLYNIIFEFIAFIKYEFFRRGKNIFAFYRYYIKRYFRKT
jgi:hypothetical protein